MSDAADLAGARPSPRPSGPRWGRDAVAALVCGVLPVALLVTAVAVPASSWSRLPARVADHWTATGTANDTAPRLVPFLLLGAIVLAGAAIVWASWAAARSGRPVANPGGGRTLVGTGLFMMSVGTAAVVMVTVANLGGGGSRSASVGAGGLIAMAGVPIALTGGATYLLRRYGGLSAHGAAGDSAGVSAPTIGLRAGERAVWTGRARGRRAWAIAAILVAGGAVTQAVTGQWVTTVVLLVVGVLVSAFTSVRVTAGARGVTVGYGPFGLRLTRFPLRRIAAAEAVDRTSAHSFGYRGSLLLFGAAAVIVRPGPALRLTLRDGKTFLVTVDDAETGAALLNDLIKARPAAP